MSTTRPIVYCLVARYGQVWLFLSLLFLLSCSVHDKRQRDRETDRQRHRQTDRETDTPGCVRCGAQLVISFFGGGGIPPVFQEAVLEGWGAARCQM